MLEFGYSLSSEEHDPVTLVSLAERAESAGFRFALISDHFHPWIEAQGQSPFVWSVLGGIAQRTSQLRIGTGVTCPLIRMHPALVAQAAATCALMLPRRFFLGVGTGENLNEHILGGRWPPVAERREMLREAIELIRALWHGGLKEYRGRYYTVEGARLYSLPAEPIPLVMAASGPKAAQLAGEVADGLISVAADAKLVSAFQKNNGNGKPCYGQLHVCCAKDRREALRTVRRVWPISALAPPLFSELRLPSQFESASRKVTEEELSHLVVCGNNVEEHLKAIEHFTRAGFTHVYFHQIGPFQEEFFRFYQSEVLPRFE
ncbi:MAG: TIGR03557 family F420-dependent LLM class oxidoreductase [Acidobacteria bacterium]|nr:TIGR03557 family F420-dependent LLM class oxidoreductase [Acidobacteriota bacterium]